jgi:biotin transport system substrate-specific component
LVDDEKTNDKKRRMTMEKRLSFEREKNGKQTADGRRISTQELVLGGVFTTLIAVGAFIKIPVPVVPFTLQFLFTMLAGLLLGGRRGAMSVGVYILLGLIGLPIFAEGGGFWYILKPSFGYLLGFMLAAYVTGRMVERRARLSTGWVIAVNFLGLFIVYAAGMIYYYVICNYVIDTPIALGPLFLYCFVLAVPGDICLCVLAAILTVRVKPVFDKMRGKGAV